MRTIGAALSAVGGGDIPKPTSEHASQILGTSWPESSETAWQHFSSELQDQGLKLFQESEGPQKDIYRIVATDQSGAFIESAVGVIQRRANTLDNRCDAYKRAAWSAKAVASQIWSAKLSMAESVSAAEATITAAKNELEPQIQAAQAVGQSGMAQALKLELQARIMAAIHLGQDEVVSASGLAAGEITTQELGIANWQPPHETPANANVPGGAEPMSNFLTGTSGVPAPLAPTSGGTQVKNVDWTTNGGNGIPQELTPNTLTNDQNGTDAGARPQSPIQPAALTNNGAGSGQPGTQAPVGSAASQGASSGGLIGHMMSPLSSMGGASSGGGGSPLSSMGSGLGSFGNMGGANPASAQGASMMNPAAAGLPATGAGVGAGTGAGTGAGSGAGLAGLGAGAAETSARLASGAATGVANGLNAVANAGSQVAQNVAPAVAQIAAQSSPLNPAAATTPASVGSMGGAPPMGMMPGGAMGGAPPVSPVGGGSPLAGPAAPSTPPPAPPPAGGAPPSIGSAPPGAQVAPLAMPQAHHGGVQSIGADGATGAVLVDQAMSVGADLISAMLTQTTLAGYIPIDFAVSLIYERTGGVTAWLATSEGASAIPLGVRVPQGVKLAVNDPVIGRELASMAAAGGGANPLQIISEHAKAREMAAPGTRVLAIASATPGVDGWTKDLDAAPVQLDAGQVRPIADLGHTLHRCEVAFPWEWKQANAFDAHDRLRIAARHMHMAVTAGHLNGPACEKVLRLFEERKPISNELWTDVHQERINALVDYDMTRMRVSYGAPELARQLATVRAAEVIESSRHYDTVEGCADLLYSTRLAGAPLSPDAAVA